MFLSLYVIQIVKKKKIIFYYSVQCKDKVALFSISQKMLELNDKSATTW